MPRHRRLYLPLALFSALLLALPGCTTGPSVSGSFDRDYTVSGPILLDLGNASGDVNITGSSDGKVHIHADVHASGFGSESPQQRLDDTIAHPPVEQTSDSIRIGKDMLRMRNLSISYTIQVPHDTEVSTAVASGAQTIRNVRGPVKVKAASGTIRVEKVDRDAQLSTASGSISATDMGNDVRVSSTSGTVDVSNVKGDVRVNAVAGTIHIDKPGGRVEAETTTGEVSILGAQYDVTAHDMSGGISVQGNPTGNSYWELKTVSGSVRLDVPSSANFHFSAEAVSGEIRTDIPIVIEEQGKHTLRAHMGGGGGRVDVHTVSGEIHVSGKS